MLGHYLISFLSFQPCAAFNLLEFHMSRAGSKWGVGFSFQHCSGNDRMLHRWKKLVYTECAGVIDKGQLHPSLNNTLCPGILNRCHELHSKISHNLQANSFLKHNHLKEKSWVFFLVGFFFPPLLNFIYSLNYFWVPMYNWDCSAISFCFSHM